MKPLTNQTCSLAIFLLFTIHLLPSCNLGQDKFVGLWHNPEDDEKFGQVYYLIIKDGDGYLMKEYHLYTDAEFGESKRREVLEKKSDNGLTFYNGMANLVYNPEDKTLFMSNGDFKFNMKNLGVPKSGATPEEVFTFIKAAKNQSLSTASTSQDVPHTSTAKENAQERNKPISAEQSDIPVELNVPYEGAVIKVIELKQGTLYNATFEAGEYGEVVFDFLVNSRTKMNIYLNNKAPVTIMGLKPSNTVKVTFALENKELVATKVDLVPIDDDPDPKTFSVQTVIEVGDIKNLNFQGNNYLQITLDGGAAPISVWCTSGQTKVVKGGVQQSFANLKEGGTIAVTGTWITQEGEHMLEAKSIEIVDGTKAINAPSKLKPKAKK